MRATKIHSRIEKDHTLRVRLPEDVTAGPAEVIVLVREGREPSGRALVDELDRIAFHCSRLPVRDSRTSDEIISYDEHGLPH